MEQVNKDATLGGRGDEGAPETGQPAAPGGQALCLPWAVQLRGCPRSCGRHGRREHRDAEGLRASLGYPDPDPPVAGPNLPPQTTAWPLGSCCEAHPPLDQPGCPGDCSSGGHLCGESRWHSIGWVGLGDAGAGSRPGWGAGAGWAETQLPTSWAPAGPLSFPSSPQHAPTSPSSPGYPPSSRRPSPMPRYGAGRAWESLGAVVGARGPAPAGGERRVGACPGVAEAQPGSWPEVSVSTAGVRCPRGLAGATGCGAVWRPPLWTVWAETAVQLALRPCPALGLDLQCGALARGHPHWAARWSTC